MQITKTRILHKRYTAAEWINQNLRQGEIGFLLSDDKTQILDVRFGIVDQLIENGPIIGLPFNQCLSIKDLIDTSSYTDEQIQAIITRLDILTSNIENTQDRIDVLESNNDNDTTYLFTPSTSRNGAFTVITTSSDGSIKPNYDIQISGWEAIEALALGKTNAYVFDNLTDKKYLDSIATKNLFRLGDVIYFKDIDLTDQWVCGISDTLINGSYYQFSYIKTESPNLEGYETVESAEAKYAFKTDILDLNLSTVGGNSNQVITSITQSAGKVTAVAKTLDVQSIASKLDETTLETSKIYTDKRIKEITGPIDESTSIKDYIDTSVENTKQTIDTTVKSRITQISTRITTNETNISNLTTRISPVETAVKTIQTDLSNLTSRVTTLENFHPFSGNGGTGTVVNGISNIYLGDKILNKDTETNAVYITEISTDLLSQGFNQLILDCNNINN